ncbi:MAG: YbaB/EbfC family nucleoid-associated protein [Clostridia bacterium]|nr:YbaB/EbfC family nucleoid-associated protein [Clostridia bacterium]
MAGFKGGFGGGFGGNQMQQLMKQAQKMQQDMQKAQEELEEAQIEGQAGSGAVTVIINGKKTLQSISIKPEVIDPDDGEMLEDLIVAAFNDAYAKADKMVKEKMPGAGMGMF